MPRSLLLLALAADVTAQTISFSVYSSPTCSGAVIAHQTFENNQCVNTNSALLSALGGDADEDHLLRLISQGAQGSVVCLVYADSYSTCQSLGTDQYTWCSTLGECFDGKRYDYVRSPPPSPPPPSLAEDPCFPSSAMVTKADGTPERIDALQEGDAILAATAKGDLTSDTVSLLSIDMPETRMTALLSLKTSTNATLTLTQEHHLPVGAVCCATLKKAKDISVGETVWAVAAGTAVSTTVTLVSKVQGKGLHSPVLTHGGFPVVDGIVTSFDAIEKVTLARHGLAPLIQACKATGTCNTLRGLFFGEDKKYLA